MRIAAVQYSQLAYFLKYKSLRLGGEGRHNFISGGPINTKHFYFDQLVIAQSAFSLFNNALAEATLTDGYDWVEMMGDST